MKRQAQTVKALAAHLLAPRSSLQGSPTITHLLYAYHYCVPATGTESGKKRYVSFEELCMQDVDFDAGMAERVAQRKVRAACHPVA